MISHILLDMDGVLADFFTGTLRYFGRPDLADHWPPGEWEMTNVLGVSVNEFWSRIDAGGADFWDDLPVFPWAHELVDLVDGTAPFTISTSPSLSPACHVGKLRWLYRFFGKKVKNYMFGADKHLMAKPEHLLIDDYDNNVAKFRKHGGTAILFPQPWNAHHIFVDRRMDFVREELYRLSKRPSGCCAPSCGRRLQQTGDVL